MPYLNITTNAPVNKRQKETIERAISKAILLIPKEKEELLMVNFEDCASLSLSGDFSTPVKSVYLIATRDLSNLWLQFFLSQNQGFMRLFEKTVLK